MRFHRHPRQVCRDEVGWVIQNNVYMIYTLYITGYVLLGRLVNWSTMPERTCHR